MSAPVTFPGQDTEPITRLRTTRLSLLEHLFDFFERKQIPYCVVGATHGLPEHADNDVDLVVAQDALHHLPGMLTRSGLGQQGRLVQIIQHEQTAYFLVFAAQEKAEPLCFLQADICSDYYRNGKRFLHAGELLTGRSIRIDEINHRRGFYVAAPASEFIYYLLKKIDKQGLSDEQGQHLSEQWHRDPLGASRYLRRFWPEPERTLLADAAKTDHWEDVRRALPALRSTLHRHLPFSPAMRWHEWGRKMHRVWHPTGLFVAFMGPDGSGKSSVIERVTTTLSLAFWRTSYMHLRPCLGTNTHTHEPVTAPHAQPPRGLLSSVAKLAYYLFDYSVGYLWKVRPLLIRTTLVISDRYYHDLLVDPKRYRYGGPPPLAQQLSKLVPKPDVFIFLDAPPDVLQARKKEVPLRESARQRNAYRDLARRLPNSYVVDASRPLHDVVAHVDRIILNVMEERGRTL